MAAGSGAAGTDETALIDEVTGAVRTLRRDVRVVAPGSISGDEAVALVDLLGEAERIVASGVARLTPRATETGAFAKTCPAHHGMKTNGGWRIVGGPARWRWLPPENPPTAGRIARTRKVAVARAKAYRPRRT
jgi:hypothetical protein